MKELKECAEKIRAFQEKLGLSDADFCRRYPGLGSTKTYKKILAGDVADLDPDRWLRDYGQVLNLITLEDRRGEEQTYDDLWHMTAVRVAVADLLRERGNNRLVIVEGPSGSGKTTAVRAVAARFGRKIVLTEADETWKESVFTVLGAILRACGCREIPATMDARRARLVEMLRVTPLCLVVDEAHHLGPRTLNVIKTLINQTECHVVFLAIPTLMRRLESAAYEEAAQLTRNRMAERVRLGAPSLKDVERFLERRLKLAVGDLSACAKVAADRAPQFGHWNWIGLVCKHAAELADGGQVDRETFARAVTRAMETR
jgi:DNA transposition AAA+ family ATPase